MEHDIWNSYIRWNVVTQFPLKTLHPRNPHNQETHISRYLAVQIQIQIEILVEHEFMPGNLSIWILEALGGVSFLVESVLMECMQTIFFGMCATFVDGKYCPLVRV